ncbi:hypothetical protein L208DRAFT_1245697 [Tricholoma matsutake]|nr:hypothetical protein L208DRAFT_1245697 [Tricholoma matsutake 945]
MATLPTKEAANSKAAINATHHPYDYCSDDDDFVSMNAVLAVRKDCPLYCTHALAETDIVSTQAVTAVLSITHNGSLQDTIKAGYKDDKWCIKLQAAAPGMPGVTEKDGLLFIGDWLVIPSMTSALFRLAHDSLGHFSFEKLYGSLQNSYYWLNMRQYSELAYVPSCGDCQQNKS